MKIFSNFDTKAPLIAYKNALQEYGADKVIFVRRHRLYLSFYVTLPLVFVGLCILIVLFFWRRTSIGGVFLNTVMTVVLVVIGLFTLVKTIANYINYLLDYTIVTPRLIISYNQTGLFKKQVRTLDTDKVKAITVSGKNMFQSIFNYGSVVFLSEGDDNDYGDITLRFLRSPNRLREEVVRIIELAKDD